MCYLFLNINFWSAFSGLVGTIFIFFFGLPAQVNPKGLSHILLEQEDKDERRKAKKYKNLSYIGLSLIGLSFSLQIINLIFKAN